MLGDVMDINDSLGLVTTKIEEWVRTIVEMLPNFVVAILVLGLFYVCAKILRNLAGKILIRLSSSAAVNNLILNIVYIFTILTGMFVALGILQLDKTVTSMLAGVGIIGLALGFAFQDTIANLVSGIIIAFRRPYDIGDIIESSGYFGKVIRIDLRTTDIQLLQGPIVLVPNKNVLQNAVVNYSEYGWRRVDLGIGVSYGEDLENVRKVTLEAVHQVENLDTSKDVTFYYEEFGDSSINFSVRFWVKYTNRNAVYLKAKSDAIINIKSAFNSAGIVIPFPIRTLDFGIKGGEKLSQMKINLSRQE